MTFGQNIRLVHCSRLYNKQAVGYNGVRTVPKMNSKNILLWTLIFYFFSLHIWKIDTTKCFFFLFFKVAFDNIITQEEEYTVTISTELNGRTVTQMVEKFPMGQQDDPLDST